MRCLALRILYVGKLYMPGEELTLSRQLALLFKAAGHVQLMEDADGTGEGVEIHTS
jgi:hypothetical protein